MARPRSAKSQALADYIAALEKKFPGVHAERMRSSSGVGDYWVRVEVPESIVLDVVDATSSLSYDWLVERGVDILASVSSTEDGEPPGQAVKGLYTTC